jgi:hypothetical protein
MAGDDSTPLKRAALYRQQAKEIRAFAEKASIPDIRGTLLGIAERYEMLAERAEKGQA